MNNYLSITGKSFSGEKPVFFRRMLYANATILLKIAALWCISLHSTAQVPEIYDFELKSKPFFVLQAGINTQITYELTNTSSSFIALEYCPKRFDHFGVQFNLLMPYLERNGLLLEKGSYEIGILNKHFFHDRLSSRKFKCYIGFEIRKGIRKYIHTIENQIEYTKSSRKDIKYMGLMGIQWVVKSLVFEFALPFGIERIKYDPQNGSNTPQYDVNNTHYIMIPTIRAGFKF